MHGGQERCIQGFGGEVACCCECSNEPSVSIKLGEYFD
jgi:hypothetical protein